jgi:hypothetical protein
MDETPRTIRIRPERAPDVRVAPITGCWGGPTPTGSVRIALYRDLTEMPEAWFREFANPSEEKVAPSEFIEVRRTVEFEAVMTPSVAKSIGEWLVKQVEKFEEAVGEKENP